MNPRTAQNARIYFVTVRYCLAQLRPSLVPVVLPLDRDKFVLIDDPEGFDIMFKHRGRWCNLDGDAWSAQWRPFETQTFAKHIGIVRFGREVLRKKYHAKEMLWSEWEAQARRRKK